MPQCCTSFEQLEKIQQEPKGSSGCEHVFVMLASKWLTFYKVWKLSDPAGSSFMEVLKARLDEAWSGRCPCPWQGLELMIFKVPAKQNHFGILIHAARRFNREWHHGLNRQGLLEDAQTTPSLQRMFVQDFFQLAYEYLQAWRLHNLSGQTVTEVSDSKCTLEKCSDGISSSCRLFFLLMLLRLLWLCSFLSLTRYLPPLTRFPPSLLGASPAFWDWGFKHFCGTAVDSVEVFFLPLAQYRAQSPGTTQWGWEEGRDPSLHAGALHPTAQGL